MPVLCLWPVSFLGFSFTATASSSYFFVLHVVVGFSPLVYNFNKILLTNSGNGRQPRRRWLRWQGGIRQRTSCPFLYLRLPTVDWRIPNRYYYYNNSGAVATTTTATVAIACQRCTCRFCSLLCWHCILLRRFDNSFYLRQDEDEDVVDAGRRLFVCHLRSIPNPHTQHPTPSPAKCKSLSSILNGAAVFFLSNGGISATQSSSSSPGVTVLKLSVCFRCPSPRSAHFLSSLFLHQSWHQFLFDFIIFIFIFTAPALKSIIVFMSTF